MTPAERTLLLARIAYVQERLDDMEGVVQLEQPRVLQLRQLAHQAGDAWHQLHTEINKLNMGEPDAPQPRDV